MTLTGRRATETIFDLWVCEHERVAAGDWVALQRDRYMALSFFVVMFV